MKLSSNGITVCTLIKKSQLTRNKMFSNLKCKNTLADTTTTHTGFIGIECF